MRTAVRSTCPAARGPPEHGDILRNAPLRILPREVSHARCPGRSRPPHPARPAAPAHRLARPERDGERRHPGRPAAPRGGHQVLRAGRRGRARPQSGRHERPGRRDDRLLGPGPGARQSGGEPPRGHRGAGGGGPHGVRGLPAGGPRGARRAGGAGGAAPGGGPRPGQAGARPRGAGATGEPQRGTPPRARLLPHLAQPLPGRRRRHLRRRHPAPGRRRERLRVPPFRRALPPRSIWRRSAPPTRNSSCSPTSPTSSASATARSSWPCTRSGRPGRATWSSSTAAG